MLKCSSERCVCAPHKRSAGTFTSPIESLSTRHLSPLRNVPSSCIWVSFPQSRTPHFLGPPFLVREGGQGVRFLRRQRNRSGPLSAGGTPAGAGLLPWVQGLAPALRPAIDIRPYRSAPR